MPRKRHAIEEKVALTSHDNIKPRERKRRKQTETSVANTKLVALETKTVTLETKPATTQLNTTTDPENNSDSSVIEILSDHEDETKKRPKIARIAGSNATIEKNDLKYLKPRQWLNDTIVDFVLQMYLDQYKLQSEVYISNSFFYSRLNEMSQDAGRKSSFDAIKRWIQYDKIFSKKLWLIPACEDHHWYLIAVVNPGKKKQFIAVMDSLNRYNASGKAMMLIKDFLSCKYLEENGKTIPPIKTLVRPIPVQENNHDCGLHLLRSVQLLMLHRSKTLELLRGHEVDSDRLWQSTPVPSRKQLRQALIRLIKS
ncbi:hypothetical protein EDC96DRAFT_517369 [Choanephora cucurbitarum]|nr:hypothetical protein EDC96DRAFT_517369 [Choanephora cucurbitarum]